MRQQVKRRGFGTAIESLDPDADVFRTRLCILDDDVEIAVVVEDARVEQLKLGGANLSPAPPVLFQ
jgi:hypothetical protein